MIDFKDILPPASKIKKTFSMLSLYTGLAITTASGTYVALEYTIISELRLRTDYLTIDRDRLTDEKTKLQSRYDLLQLKGETALKEQAENLNSKHDAEMREVSQNYVAEIRENESLKKEISSLRQNDMQVRQSEKKKRLADAEARFSEVREQITEAYEELKTTSSQYGYAKKRCAGDERDIFVGVCEESSRYEALMTVIKDNITSLEKQSSQINEQLLGEKESER
jgi:hypothetical protein